MANAAHGLRALGDCSSCRYAQVVFDLPSVGDILLEVELILGVEIICQMVACTTGRHRRRNSISTCSCPWDVAKNSNQRASCRIDSRDGT